MHACMRVMHTVNHCINLYQVVCPVCREALTDVQDIMDAPPSPETGKFVFKKDEALEMLQEEMAKLFAQQKAKGGIIDLEAEKNKYLITSAVRVASILRLFFGFVSFTEGVNERKLLITQISCLPSFLYF